MNIKIEKKNQGLVVELVGALYETGNAEAFAKSVREATAEPYRFVVFDFNDASLPDSRFISKIIEIQKENKRRKVATYLLCGRNPDVLEMFRISFLDKLMPVISDLNQVTL